ncbi:MAG: efflux RND transporter periplasmic adaptor subunit [Proteobacteria bacterium]|uniref:efflux RND transporter periplasmic adaptor subunit n=1 Tax=Rudaea sp. TaxID=2136325 RepID=UPI001DE05B2E|nr:efflux RND transporter periplasmic adaptor subunit [Pseudomonadota bacterium]MBS0568902.1 efflux RND transporter periplasmic adaptor subunit [Pseudomonadota bacterium]
MNKSPRLVIIVVAIGLAVATAFVWKQLAPAGKAKSGGKPPPLVGVTTSRTLDLPVYFAAQGHIVPLNQVDVRPQVAGVIRTVNFREGDEVKPGQLLFELDAADVVAQLRRAEANANQIRAQMDDATRDLNRTLQLVKSGFMSAAVVDTARSKAESLQAQYKAAQADVDSARVRVGYMHIVSPIAGKAGALAVHPGSLAQPGDAAALVSIVQFDPISVEFTLPERNLAAVRDAHAAGTTQVSIDLDDGTKRTGQLSFIDNRVNASTGTIGLKATFENADRHLWPGAYARVALNAGISKGSVVLPPQAVLEGPEGHFVFQVGADNKVAVHPVNLLRIQDNNAVIEGLDNGATVVVEGARSLRDGIAVTIDKSPAAATAANANGAAK